MAFLDSTSSIIDAIITRKGRELLAKNDGSFKVTKYAFADDEINYQLYDASNQDNPDANILVLPVLEPVSNEAVAAKYRLITLPEGSQKIATLSINPTNATVDYGDTVTFTTHTDNGEDSQGYTIVSRDTDIAKVANSKETPDANGEAIFTMYTGANAGAKAGTVILDITGVNSGARGTFTLTVSSSG